MSTVSFRTAQFPTISQNPVIIKDTLFRISKETLSVFPNPSNGQFSVQLFNGKAEIITIQILTESGMMVEQRSLSMSGETANKKVDFNLSRQASGIYFVKIITSKGIQIRKVVIVH